MNIKWNMNGKIFTGENNGYKATIILGAALGCPYWEIVKNGSVIDTCYRHSPTTDELSAKVQIERIIDNLLKHN